MSEVVATIELDYSRFAAAAKRAADEINRLAETWALHPEAVELARRTPWHVRDWQMALDAIAGHPYRDQLLRTLEQPAMGPRQVGALLWAYPRPWWSLDRHHPPRLAGDGAAYDRRRRARRRRR